MTESDLKAFISSINPSKQLNLDLKFERIIAKGRVSCSMLARKGGDAKSLLLVRLYAKRSNQSTQNALKKRNSSLSIGSNTIDPLSATKMSFIHELYYEKCSQFDFVLKPLLINDSDDFLILVRPFLRYNLPDRLNNECLGLQDKYWIASQLVDAFLKLHSLRAFHGDFGTGKIFLTSQNKVVIGDFAPIKPFCLQNKNQSPIEFYQIWFDEGIDSEMGEIGRGCYLAPERLRHNTEESFGPADLFSLGCVLAEIFGRQGFLQFKDVYNLSKADDYEAQFQNLLGSCGVQDEGIQNIIKRICSQDPKMRRLSKDDIIFFQSKIDTNFYKFRKYITEYKDSLDFLAKKDILLKLPNQSEDYESPILMVLKENNYLLRSLLIDYVFKFPNTRQNESVMQVLADIEDATPLFYKVAVKENYPNWPAGFKKVFPKLGAVKTGNKDYISRLLSLDQSYLQEIISILSDVDELEKDAALGILNKLVQIYRASENYDLSIESLLAFEYFRRNNNEDGLEELFKHFKSLNLKTDQIQAPASSRVAFQLDLEKNKVPIELKTGSSEIKKAKSLEKPSNLSASRMKQRVLNGPMSFELEDDILGIIQSPDKSIIIIFSLTNLLFWELKTLARRKGTENAQYNPLACINPRSEAIISNIIFGEKSDIIFISFRDGIIGQYKLTIEGNNLSFSIKESFGPFGDGFLLTKTCFTQSGLNLLVVSKHEIFGINMENGNIEFECKQNVKEINNLVDIVDGCAVLIDDFGNFYLIELFYETGQILATWSLKITEETFKWDINAMSLRKDGNKFKLLVKIDSKHVGTCNVLFTIDPLNSIPICIFRHWTIKDDSDDKILPQITCVCGPSESDLFYVNCESRIICLDEEFVEASTGIIRLIDFKCLSALNCSSILYPSNYKPSLKLRNKKSQIPELIEKQPLKPNFDKKCLLSKIWTIDEKNMLVIAVIDDEIILFG